MEHLPVKPLGVELLEYDTKGSWFVPDHTSLQYLLAAPLSLWLESYNSGLRQIFIHQDLCDENLFHSRLESLNLLVQKNEQKKSAQVQIFPHEEKNLRKLFAQAQQNKINSSRRRLFSNLRPVLQPANTSENLSAEHWPHSLSLTMSTCTACDDCTKICPLKALWIESSGEGQAHYRLNPQQCDGCGLCQNVCPTDSIEIKPFRFTYDQKFPMLEKLCAYCHKTYNVNPQLDSVKNTVATEENRCAVCSKSQELHNDYQLFKNLKGTLRVVDK